MTAEAQATTPRISVVIADSDHLLAEGLQALLEKKGIRVTGHATDGYVAYELLRTLRPDVCLVNLALPRLNGIDLVFKIRSLQMETRMIMLGSDHDPDHVLKSLKFGALGYVWKGSSFRELEMAIHAVKNGQVFVSPPVNYDLMLQYFTGSLGSKYIEERLTARQRQVMQLIAEGSTNKEVATSLAISVKAVDKHRSELMKRLRVHNAAQLVLRAVKLGIVKA
jgi:DNA-binding NarL/FixJ family response regulator